MEPFSGNQRPDLPICLLEMSLVLRLPRVHVCRSSWNAPRMPLFLKLGKTITFCFLFAMCRIHCTCHAQWGFNIQKWSGRGMCLACCRVRFLCSQTAKSALDVVCFYQFELDMCFAPQPRALSQRCNSKNFPNIKLFWHFGFEKCFAPQPHAHFRQAWLPKALHTQGVLWHLDLEACFAPQPRVIF